jgi:preprotein translocase subunit SecA
MTAATLAFQAPVPRPGPVLGRYPQRPDAMAAWRAPFWAVWLQRLLAPPLALPDPAPVRVQQAAWRDRPLEQWPEALQALRARLAREGLQGPARIEALGCVAAALQRELGRDPFDTQLACAQVLLDGALAEMATGEGKTLAVALAAGVAGLAGVPVHVMTANDYLAARDAQTLAPMFAALGLRTGVVLAATDPAARRVAYACDITYCTAREVAFDHLRDRLLLQGQGSDLQQRAAALGGEAAPQPMLPGLCMALVDEADSLLIDEATMPLVLAETVDDPAQRAACFQALALARRLEPGRDVQVDPASHQVHWSPEGEDLLEAAAVGLGGAWLNRRHRADLVGSALVALHALQRERDYLLRDGRIELLDAVTGRTAAGRVWSRGLQTLVELKEGCIPTPATRTTAQTSFQRFFARYWHLAGTSGTLAECRAELAAIYGKPVVTIPRRRPDQHRHEPLRVFADGQARAQTLIRRVTDVTRLGRPVLVGCESVADTQALSQALQQAGIPHTVLDARHDAEEAAIVARAGQAGAVTVATAMAGRGTDIELGPGVAERGGLHVIACQDSRSARSERQFTGRAARQGDPGSSEVWLALDAPAWRDAWGSSWLRSGRRDDMEGGLGWPREFLHAWMRAGQRMAQNKQMRQRRRLLEQDLSWQTRLEFTRLRA